MIEQSRKFAATTTCLRDRRCVDGKSSRFSLKNEKKHVPQIKLHAEHLWSKSLHSFTLSFFIPGRTPATTGRAWQAEIACLRAIY